MIHLLRDLDVADVQPEESCTAVQMPARDLDQKPEAVC